MPSRGVTDPCAARTYNMRLSFRVIMGGAYRRYRLPAWPTKRLLSRFGFSARRLAAAEPSGLLPIFSFSAAMRASAEILPHASRRRKPRTAPAGRTARAQVYLPLAALSKCVSNARRQLMSFRQQSMPKRHGSCRSAGCIIIGASAETNNDSRWRSPIASWSRYASYLPNADIAHDARTL